MTDHLVMIVFKASLMIFMIGNLSSMGLQLNVKDAVRPLMHWRFMTVTLLSCFVYCPVVALVLIRLIPLQQPYVVGLMLLSLAPAAPFLPLVVSNAKGDLSSAAAFMLVASVGTVLIMPLGVPYLAPGMSASPWAVAKPLLILVLLPLAIAMVVRNRSESLARRLYVYDKVITSAGTALFLVIVAVMHYRNVVGAIGSYALATQVLFVVGMTVGGYLLALPLPVQQRVVISLGVCTRNIGAAVAIVGSGGDQSVMVMLVIGTIATVIMSFGASAWFAYAAESRVLPTGARK